VKYVLSFNDNTLISENTPLKTAEKQWILTNNHSYKYNTANQWIHWFLLESKIKTDVKTDICARIKR